MPQIKRAKIRFTETFNKELWQIQEYLEINHPAMLNRVGSLLDEKLTLLEFNPELYQAYGDVIFYSISICNSVSI